MFQSYLQILTLITIFAINGIKSDDTIEALRKILKELNAPIENRYDDVNYNSKFLYQPRYHKHAKAKHGRNAPNLMNVQTMNLFLKPNKRQRDEEDVKRLLRTDAEDICKATGRCGCTGTRCGKNKNDDLVDEVDRVVNEINEQLATYDNMNRKHRNTFNLNDERDERNEIVDRENDNRHRNNDDYNPERDRDQDTLKEENGENEFEDDHGDKIKHIDNYDKDDLEIRIVDRKDRIDANKLFKNNKIKINDNLDVVILDKSDIDALLRNKDFIDLTRKDVDDDDDDNEDREIFEKVIREFKKIVASEEKDHSRSTHVITPEDFVGNYETVKQQIVANVFDYIRNKRTSTFLNLQYLSPYQKSKLRSVKLKYNRGELQDESLEEEIVKILFGEHSNMKIVAQNENNNKIYVPEWIYNKVLNSKRSLPNYMFQKRILPLTLQQRIRIGNKEKGRYIPKLVWRKNGNQDVQRYGIPFDFEVHGLSQIAP